MLAFLRLILKFYLARYPHEQKKSFEEAILRMVLNSYNNLKMINGAKI